MPGKVRAMPGVRYKHVKTGGFYEVLDIATLEATGELAVVYKSTENCRRWIRPYEEFCDGRFVYGDAR